MRQIEKAMCEAVRNRKNWKSDNTRVEVCNGGNVVNVYLYEHCIFKVENGVKKWSFAGWSTMTTKSRLRALGVDYKKAKSGVYEWNAA